MDCLLSSSVTYPDPDSVRIGYVRLALDPDSKLHN
jgi:hypothetical protein